MTLFSRSESLISLASILTISFKVRGLKSSHGKSCAKEVEMNKSNIKVRSKRIRDLLIGFLTSSFEGVLTLFLLRMFHPDCFDSLLQPFRLVIPLSVPQHLGIIHQRRHKKWVFRPFPLLNYFYRIPEVLLSLLILLPFTVDRA